MKNFLKILENARNVEQIEWCHGEKVNTYHISFVFAGERFDLYGIGQVNELFAVEIGEGEYFSLTSETMLYYFLAVTLAEDLAERKLAGYL